METALRSGICEYFYFLLLLIRESIAIVSNFLYRFSSEIHVLRSLKSKKVFFFSNWLVRVSVFMYVTVYLKNEKSQNV
uniref:Uncharacterized protein n=1 Tax=Panstrongylus lignarius TaxID=156445 RepID=A0A224XT52_9HEMI